GLRIPSHKTFREVRGEIDTLLVAGGAAIENDEIPIEVVRWLRKIAGRIRRIGSVCTGALLLGRAGMLDGRRATTHWNWCALLARKYPRAEVDPDPIFVRDDMVYTSAGVTAGMDLALALVEEDHGSRPATGRKSKQHGNDCWRVRIRKRQFNAYCISAGIENCTGTISTPLPQYASRETPDEAWVRMHLPLGSAQPARLCAGVSQNYRKK